VHLLNQPPRQPTRRGYALERLNLNNSLTLSKSPQAPNTDRQQVTFAGWAYKQCGSRWQRFFFTVTGSAVLYYAQRYEVSSLSGYCDRSVVHGVEGLSEEMDGERRLYTVRMDVGQERLWVLGFGKAAKRAQFCAEVDVGVRTVLEFHSRVSFGNSGG
jgi:hypothetical protein